MRTGGRTPDDVVADVLAGLPPAADRPMRRVTVPGEPPYDVVIGDGRPAELGLVLAGTPKVAVVHPGRCGGTAGRPSRCCRPAGVAAEAVVVPDGEAAKTAEVAAALGPRSAGWA